MASAERVVDYLEQKLRERGLQGRMEAEDGFKVLRILKQGKVVGGLLVPGVESLDDETAVGVANALLTEALKAAAREPAFREG